MSKMPMLPNRNMTVPEVAELKRVSSELVRRWIASGELRAVDCSSKKGSRKPRWRISQADLEAFDRARANTTDSPLPRVRRKKPTFAGMVEYIK